MNKKALEKEIAIRGDEWASTKTADRGGYYFAGLSEGYYNGYIASAEPREKQIAELEEKLANADYQLEGRDLEIKKLKAQIEKMKCCYNCKHSRTEYEHCRTDKSENWEIKEK